jgi:hypothetical protein
MFEVFKLSRADDTNSVRSVRLERTTSVAAPQISRRQLGIVGRAFRFVGLNSLRSVAVRPVQPEVPLA